MSSLMHLEAKDQKVNKYWTRNSTHEPKPNAKEMMLFFL